MSLITRCPACETLFKVVPDQLRVSDGWVRCGQCDEVFDASLHLLEMPPDGGMPAIQQEEVAVIHNATDAVDVTAQPVDIDFDLDMYLGSQGSPDALLAEQEQEQEQVLSDAVEDGPDQPLEEPIPDEFSRADEVISLSADWPDVQSDGSSAARSTPALPDHEANSDVDDAEPDSIAGLGEVSFLRDKRTGTFWDRPLMRATLVFLTLALSLGLTGQIVIHERDRIVASEPGLKPWLEKACVLLNCTLSPLRGIESIVIDSSSFTKIRGDAYRVNFTLKNAAAVALAVPAIELTLTNSLDQPVVRRVFLPSDFGAKIDTLAASAEWPASLAVAVKAEDLVDRIAGYRLLAFYP
ncbi:zinc-ribbon and DUF3426 domain-containing protein [Rhodoferax sp.]|uniref:zinc-ribbon and DUF3426 domain-containing protein n=1 Tax=Rhodoferax sp. TaxID=50421 RepID=UPI00271E852A|nr:zinc-ribbon and DUF3426 domain-containing protein [Rhodoferax sp.]MDO9195357.1 zinc-ribbon and DUF3426 domain-containing protein [Rhodoferax sp.]